MKKFVLLIVALWATFFSIAQNPDFRMPLLFEDQGGNKATIIIGYKLNDPSIYHQFSPQLGEDSIAFSEPFDSVFDIRILSNDIHNLYYQTVSIGAFEGNCDGGSAELVQLRIRAKKRPLNISWDIDSLYAGTNPGCHGEIAFFANSSFGLLPNNFEQFGKYLKDIAPPEFEEDFVQQTGEFSTQVEMLNIIGGGQDTVFRSYVLMRVSAASNTNDSENNADDWQIFPNPCQNWVTIRPPTTDFLRSKMELFDASGRQVFLPAFFSNDAVLFETEKLPTGLYFLKMQPKKGPPVLQKFMVVR